MNNPMNTASEADALAPSDEDVRILRRITPVNRWPELDDPVEPVRRIAVLDTETTGFDPARDRVIAISAAIVLVDARGRVVAVERRGTAYQDPGIALPPQIVKLTGLTDEKLAGQSINVDNVTRFLGRAEVIVAHNCSFDRPFVEALLPGASHLPWACSMRDFDWLDHGFDGAKLGHLVNQVGLFMPKAHDAAADVEALVNLLAHELPDGETVMGKTLAKASRLSWRLEATHAPYDWRHELKSRGYRWDNARKVWWIEGDDAVRLAEVEWLKERWDDPGYRPEITEVNWHERYR